MPSLRRFSSGPGKELNLRLESLETLQYRSKALARMLSVIQTLSRGARTCLMAALEERAVGRDAIGGVGSANRARYLVSRVENWISIAGCSGDSRRGCRDSWKFVVVVMKLEAARLTR
jgi:hypothetical protein